MRSKFARTAGAALMLGGLLALPACDRDRDDDHEDEFAALEVIDRSTGEVTATWTEAAGWDGFIPDISLSSTNQRISIGFRAFMDDGDEIPLSREGPFSIRHALAPGAPQGIIDMDHPDHVLFHGDHVHIYGAQEGTTQVVFWLWHIDHFDDQTTAINVNVVP